jgi:lipoic acid synthetase
VAAPRDNPGRKPAWLKHKAPAPRQYRATGALLDELDLHTVCREARCPNKGECYSSGTATFLILGDVCTRACTFCAVEGEGKAAARGAARGREAAAGGPGQRRLRAPDEDEPRRLAEAARRLGLRHVVVTSVTRDDLPDGGAAQFAASIAAVRAAVAGATVEVLVPDLGGDEAALGAVLAARPDVLNHNLETVPRLYPEVRPQARYARSLKLLSRAAAWARAPGAAAYAAAGAPPARPLVKTGLMVGLGETGDELAAVLADAAAAGVDAVTIGQYLPPAAGCHPVARYVAPEEFEEYRRHGERLGLTVVAAPLVRSSYRAGELLERDA